MASLSLQKPRIREHRGAQNPFAMFSPTCVILLAGGLYLFYRRIARNVNLPPGPRADPVIKHLRIFPVKDHAEVFHEWATVYGERIIFYRFILIEPYVDGRAGDVMHFSALGRSFVVLGSKQAAVDLLERRSPNYSDRPSSPMNDL